MYDELAMIMILNTLTSTHPGSGTELSYIDMPVQREGYTGFPKLEAATLKGCIRHGISKKGQDEKENIDRIFGKPDQGEFASAVSITDARLLFFPVKSAKGVFGWITCPAALKRFYGDYKLAFGKEFPAEGIIEGDFVTAVVRKGSKLCQALDGKEVIMLEDYTFAAEENERFDSFVQAVRDHLPEGGLARSMILEKAVLLSDDDFSAFVKYSTEVSTRIRINPRTGTAEGSGLFTEEYLPPECIFYSLAFFTDSHRPQNDSDGGESWKADTVKATFSRLFSERTIQVGADSTLGKGFVGVEFWGGEQNE